jgi:hypothetical protein
VMPGTFYDDEDERAFLDRLVAAPPRLAIWPLTKFDNMKKRGLSAIAPQLSTWVRRNYVSIPNQGDYRERYALLIYAGARTGKAATRQ